MALVGVLSTAWNVYVWPALTAPDDATRDASRRVGTALLRGQDLATVPEAERLLFLEHADWREADVVHFDRAAAAAREMLASGGDHGDVIRHPLLGKAISLLWFCEADEALEVLAGFPASG